MQSATAHGASEKHEAARRVVGPVIVDYLRCRAAKGDHFDCGPAGADVDEATLRSAVETDWEVWVDGAEKGLVLEIPGQITMLMVTALAQAYGLERPQSMTAQPIASHEKYRAVHLIERHGFIVYPQALRRGNFYEILHSPFASTRGPRRIHVNSASRSDWLCVNGWVPLPHHPLRDRDEGGWDVLAYGYKGP
ncbi:hypothetical protein ACFLEY_18795 [Bradyrhizobium sp. YCK136]|uniref:hypothetical protein n=1 Tax=Bradyrhizobium TaxID=374 RepID=UPI0037CAEC23